LITQIKQKDEITEKIIACCFKVHNELGPGFNERIYHNALITEFEGRGLKYETEKEFIIEYTGKWAGKLRVDLVIENSVVLEIKALAGNIPQLFKYQVISYLKSSKFKTGLLVNFGNTSCQIKRLVY